MEKEKRDVIFQPEAQDSIFHIYCYIAKKGYPETAEKFYDELYDFGYTLNNFPEKYPICRQARFRKRKMHCAVFHKNYIFLYKVVKDKLIIYNVIHGKALR